MELQRDFAAGTVQHAATSHLSRECDAGSDYEAAAFGRVLGSKDGRDGFLQRRPCGCATVQPGALARIQGREYALSRAARPAKACQREANTFLGIRSAVKFPDCLSKHLECWSVIARQVRPKADLADQPAPRYARFTTAQETGRLSWRTFSDSQ